MNDTRQRGDHPSETEFARREKILHEELERRLDFFESGDDSDFGMGARATGGLEWPRGAGQAFFVELSLGFGDTHDAAANAMTESAIGEAYRAVKDLSRSSR